MSLVNTVMDNISLNKDQIESISYEIGVLLYHATPYGHAEFDISGVIMSLSNKIPCFEDMIYNGFVAEASDYIERELCIEDELNEVKVKALFDSVVEELELKL